MCDGCVFVSAFVCVLVVCTRVCVFVFLFVLLLSDVALMLCVVSVSVFSYSYVLCCSCVSLGVPGSWLFSGNVIKHPSGQGDGTVFQTLYNPRIVQRLTGSLRKISNYLTGSPETQAAANDEEVQASLFEAGQAIEMDELPNGIRQPDEGQGHHRTDLAGAQSD
eukprot:GHVQ01006610.1.p1 GENE.GHVQ01006610.1~~GHVQ01006610.1.p1  ORF type:complete len:164 (+),score=18.48 GHVQ01006610.1:182-673(+)